jgi:hypothetical protein
MQLHEDAVEEEAVVEAVKVGAMATAVVKIVATTPTPTPTHLVAPSRRVPSARSVRGLDMKHQGVGTDMMTMRRRNNKTTRQLVLHH